MPSFRTFPPLPRLSARLVCSLLLATGLVSVLKAEYITYYVDNGHGLQKLQTNDPDSIKVVEWQCRLYPSGHSPSGEGYWGVLNSYSVAQLKRKLQASQSFELSYARFMHGNTESAYQGQTYFNPLLPIAVVRPSLALKNQQVISHQRPEVDRMIRRIFEIKAQLTEGFQTGAGQIGEGHLSPENQELVRNALRDVRQYVIGSMSALIAQGRQRADLLDDAYATSRRSLEALEKRVGVAKKGPRGPLPPVSSHLILDNIIQGDRHHLQLEVEQTCIQSASSITITHTVWDFVDGRRNEGSADHQSETILFKGLTTESGLADAGATVTVRGTSPNGSQVAIYVYFATEAEADEYRARLGAMATH